MVSKKRIKRVGVASAEPDGWETSQIVECIQNQGIECVIFDVTQTIVRVGNSKPHAQFEKENLMTLDGVFTRAVPGGSLEQVILRMDILHCLKLMGIPFMNTPSAIEKAVDKYYALRLLELGGIPIPRTEIAQFARDALRAFRRFKDVVIKPLFGSGGVGMTRITDGEIARRVFRALEASRYVMYVQEFHEHDNRDIRVFVIGGKAVAAMYRVGPDWKTTLRHGARPEPCDLTPLLTRIAEKSARIIGLGYTGVDIIETSQGPLVTEVNSSSGWQGLQQVTDFNIAESLVTHFLEVIRKQRGK